MGFIDKLFKPKLEQPTPLPPAAIPPTLANPAIMLAGDTAAKKAKAGEGAGFGDTVTNKGAAQGLGLTQASSLATPSLLG